MAIGVIGAPALGRLRLLLAVGLALLLDGGAPGSERSGPQRRRLVLERLPLLVEVVAEVVGELATASCTASCVSSDQSPAAIFSRSVLVLRVHPFESGRRGTRRTRSTLMRSRKPLVAAKTWMHLVLDRQRLALALVERLDEALAAGQRALRVGVEVGAELRERLEVAVLRELELEPAGDPLHRPICALPPTRETEMPTLIAGRTPELNSCGSRKICPSVIEITFVGM